MRGTNFTNRHEALLALAIAGRYYGCVEIIALANEDDRLEAIGLENEFTVGADGWVKIAPYGEHLKERTVQDRGGERRELFVQRLDRPAAQAMVDKFNSFWGKVKRFVVGVPIFKRHPDLAEHSPGTVGALANDKTPYGMFGALDAREDGFYGRPVMSLEGRAAIENEGLKYLSPFWWGKISGEKSGIPVMSPFELISAGLTDRPNIIGGEALANTKNQKENEMDKKKLHAALVAAGIAALANEPTDDQIITAIQSLGQKASGATALENERQSLTTEKSSLEARLGTEKSAREVAERERGEAKTALANERKARVDLILDQALQEGRITPAQRPQLASDLGALQGEAFDSKVKALANEKVQINTRSQTGNLGARKSEADQGANAQQQVISLANERMATAKCTWDQAWAWVRREKPELFELMNGAQS